MVQINPEDKGLSNFPKLPKHIENKTKPEIKLFPPTNEEVVPENPPESSNSDGFKNDNFKNIPLPLVPNDLDKDGFKNLPLPLQPDGFENAKPMPLPNPLGPNEFNGGKPDKLPMPLGPDGLEGEKQAPLKVIKPPSMGI